MALADQIRARATDIEQRLANLDLRYQMERADLLNQLQQLKNAAQLVTPEIQKAIDALGAVLTIPGVK